MHEGPAPAPQASPAGPERSRPRIAVFVIAYNAVTTLVKVLDRIPEGFRKRLAEVFVFDDSSKDDTYLLGMGYKAVREFENLNIFRNPTNLGYGGNQKRGYRYAIEQGHDIVALLHGDGQYAPEHLEELVAPIERGEADAVFGSRMMVPGAARKGGMPLYKYVGNRVLTVVENRLLGMKLTEFHSGYRVYSTRALASIPFEENADGFHFDTEIIIQLHQRDLRIVEKPIPTFYGDEVCYVNGLRYARDILRAVVRYRLHQSGIRTYANFISDRRPVIGTGRQGRHRKMARAVRGSRVLDVGCGPGSTAELVRDRSVEIVGLDWADQPRRSPRLDRFVRRRLDDAPDPAALGRFDTVLLTDALERTDSPEALLRRCRSVLEPGGRLVVCVPNIAHWRKRLKLLFGGFGHATRGTFESTERSFFTLDSVVELVERCGYAVERVEATPLPLPDLFPELAGTALMAAVQFLQNLAANAWKSLFGFQFIVSARLADRGEPVRAER